jgi:catechol 2,3-dioxygenase-like lactoylglutathione lyase family enzyme
MKILGPDLLIFGVDDVDACVQCGTDYGLKCVERSASGAVLEALDGTGLMVRKAGDAGLPAATAATPNLRETRYGVADKDTLQAIGASLSGDREVQELSGGVLRSTDADGYPISFAVTARRKLNLPHYGYNVPGQAPGQAPGRAINEIAVANGREPVPLTLSHVVMFTKDKVGAERFYHERLGFRTTDVFSNAGPFMRPAGTLDHHTLFLIQAPPRGAEHFTFHFAGANEVLEGGWRFAHKGYKSFWGPGRHLLGSNYFWYFRSPFGGNIEFDADMDQHDDSWKPRQMLASEDTSQVFNLQYADKWIPMGKPP